MKFEDDLMRKTKPLPYKKSVKIYEAMWKEAVSLGVMPPKDPLQGIETDIRLAKVLNSCLKRPSKK